MVSVPLSYCAVASSSVPNIFTALDQTTIIKMYALSVSTPRHKKNTDPNPQVMFIDSPAEKVPLNPME